MRVSSCYAYFNHTYVKERIKNAVSIVTFVVGLVEIHHVCHMLAGRIDSLDVETTALDRISLIFAKASFLLSATVSRPGLLLVSGIMKRVFTQQQMEHIFGPSTICARNPRHPRHVASIAAVGLALSALITSGYQTICKGRQILSRNDNLILLFITITSRPFLHISNQLCLIRKCNQKEPVNQIQQALSQ